MGDTGCVAASYICVSETQAVLYLCERQASPHVAIDQESSAQASTATYILCAQSHLTFDSTPMRSSAMLEPFVRESGALVPNWTYVKLRDLVGRPELNGRIGHLKEGPNSNGRFQVALLSLRALRRFSAEGDPICR